MAKNSGVEVRPGPAVRSVAECRYHPAYDVTRHGQVIYHNHDRSGRLFLPDIMRVRCRKKGAVERLVRHWAYQYHKWEKMIDGEK